MWNLRRNKTTPVQVHRAGDEPEQIVIDAPRRSSQTSSAAAPVNPAQQPGVTQNIVYITTPPQQSPPSQTPQSPAPEVHYHTTVIQAPRPRTRYQTLSFFGTAGLVLGALGCAAAFVSPAESFIHPLAIAGLAAAGLGLLSAILFGRAGKGVPVLALLVSGAALALWFQHNGGQLESEMEKLKSKLPADLRTIDLGGSPNPAPDTKKSAAPAPVPTPPLPSSPIPTTDAKAALETARQTAAKKLGLDYEGAKAAAEKTKAELLQARSIDVPASPELIAADQRATDADSALKMIEQKLRSEPAVSAAEKAVGK